MDQALAAMIEAWSVSPGAVGHPDQPHLPLYVGGGVRATARRAVRFRLPLSLPDHRPDLAEYYTDLAWPPTCSRSC